MNKHTILTAMLPLSVLLLLVGALLKILHWAGADVLLLLGLLAELVFLVTALVEVATARTSGGTKVLWMLVLLGGGVLGAFIYLLVGHPRLGAAESD